MSKYTVLKSRLEGLEKGREDLVKWFAEGVEAFIKGEDFAEDCPYYNQGERYERRHWEDGFQYANKLLSDMAKRNAALVSGASSCLRDQMAASALPFFLKEFWEEKNFAKAAWMAYLAGDAMLRARGGGKDGYVKKS